MAGIRPSFSLDYSSWHATNIVVVTPLADDGRLQVLESWKGDLSPGSIITVPELAPQADSVPIVQYPREPFLYNELATRVPRVFPGSKIVLYLEKNSDSTGNAETAPQWAAANIFHDMKASAAWIEDDRAYGFVQIMNPGPSLLVQLSYVTESNASGMRVERLSESGLKQRTFNVLRLQQQIEAAVSIEDGRARAEALKSYADSRIVPGRMFVLEELGKCGETALPTIRSMLDDPKFSSEDAALVEDYAKAGGTDAGPELTSRLEADLRYWQAIGPTLPVGWWNVIDEKGIWADRYGYRDRYSQTLALVRSLDKIHYVPAVSAVVQLRDFWKSLPQLNDPSGINHMAIEADQLVNHLQSKVRRQNKRTFSPER